MTVRLTALPLLAALAILLAGCTTTSTDPPSLDPDIVMVGSVNDPKTLTVAVGTTVAWRNDDAFGHNVMPDDTDLWGTQGSGDMRKGDTWSFTFTAPGTYDHHCDRHSGLDGRKRTGQTCTVVVT